MRPIDADAAIKKLEDRLTPVNLLTVTQQEIQKTLFRAMRIIQLEPSVVCETCKHWYLGHCEVRDDATIKSDACKEWAEK